MSNSKPDDKRKDTTTASTTKTAISPFSSAAFRWSQFQCKLQGEIACEAPAGGISREQAVRHLETNALSQFVVTNRPRFFVSRDRSGDVYYMTFTSLAPAPPTVVSPRNADKKVDKDKEDKRGTNSTAPGDVVTLAL